MTKQRGLLEVKFKGRGLRPDKILAKDLAEVIRDVEAAVLAYLSAEADDKSILKITGLSLVEIKAGSAALRFAPRTSEAVTPAFQAFATDVGHTGNVTALKARARSSYEGIQDFCQKYRCISEFRDRLSSRKPIAIIRPPIPIARTRPIMLEGETSIYGTLESVGGLDPKAWLRTDHGRVNFDVTQDQARELGQRLYTRIGVRGVARWDAYTSAVSSFKFLELLAYREKPLSQAFQSLRDEFGHCFSSMDVAAFLKEQRGE